MAAATHLRLVSREAGIQWCLLLRARLGTGQKGGWFLRDTVPRAGILKDLQSVDLRTQLWKSHDISSVFSWWKIIYRRGPDSRGGDTRVWIPGSWFIVGTIFVDWLPHKHTTQHGDYLLPWGKEMTWGGAQGSSAWLMPERACLLRKRLPRPARMRISRKASVFISKND